MFMGEYSHTIDSKGRLIIPAKFRECMGESFVVTQGLDGCLFGYADEAWKALEQKVMNLPLSSERARKFSRFILGSAVQAEIDKQGRILLPPKLRNVAHLTKDVVLVGLGDRIEIWNKELWEEKSTYEDTAELAEEMEGLGI